MKYTLDVVERINEVLYSDSRITIDPTKLMVAIEEDCGACGSVPPGLPLPTEEEVDLLVMGNEDGEIPEELEKRFPRTSKLIEDQF